jgi:invasion protein IalB
LPCDGLREASNLFVTADGTKWDANYVPAYVRRYPFVFLRHDNDDLTLCIDEAAKAFETGQAWPLFKDGKRTPVVEHALRFCIEFQRGHLATEAFMKGLVEQDLLIPYRITSTLESGEKLGATGLKVVDEARLKLPDDVVLDWHRKSCLGLISAHLASAGCWAQLVKRLNARPAASPSMPPLKHCELGLIVQNTGDRNVLAQVAVGRPAAAEPLRFSIVLPANIAVSVAPKLVLEGKDAASLDLTWLRCLPGGCIATATVSDDLLRKLKSSPTPGRIEYHDAASREIKLSITLRGFGEAFDALGKEAVN